MTTLEELRSLVEELAKRVEHSRACRFPRGCSCGLIPILDRARAVLNQNDEVRDEWTFMDSRFLCAGWMLALYGFNDKWIVVLLDDPIRYGMTNRACIRDQVVLSQDEFLPSEAFKVGAEKLADKAVGVSMVLATALLTFSRSEK